MCLRNFYHAKTHYHAAAVSKSLSLQVEPVHPSATKPRFGLTATPAAAATKSPIVNTRMPPIYLTSGKRMKAGTSQQDTQVQLATLHNARDLKFTTRVLN